MQDENQEKSQIKRNISLFLTKKGISHYDFYKKTGITRGVLSQNNGISEDNLMRFLAYYGEVNPLWLLTGNGEMLITKCISTHSPMPKEAVDSALYKDTHKQIDDVQIHKNKINNTPEIIIDQQRVPLYDIYAAAGIMQIFQGSHAHIPVEYITIPRAPRCDGAMYVTGDSMYPILKSGDIVMYTQIHDIDMYLQWGEMYIVAFGNDGDDMMVVVKYINKTDTPDLVRLVSHNQHHADKDIPKSSIRALARVKASIRFQSM